MPAISKHRAAQRLLESHFVGQDHEPVRALLIYLVKYEVTAYRILIDRFKHGYKFHELSDKYNYDIRHIQRILVGTVYRKLYKYGYVCKHLDNNST